MSDSRWAMIVSWICGLDDQLRSSRHGEVASGTEVRTVPFRAQRRFTCRAWRGESAGS